MKKIITLVLTTMLISTTFAQNRPQMIMPNHGQIRPIHPFFFIKPKKVEEKKDVVIVTYDKKDWERLKYMKRAKFNQGMRRRGFPSPPPFRK